MRRIVVAGASLAGLKAARTLRDLGFDGELTLAGAEPHPPYDRPPLTKRLLDRDFRLDEIDLAVPAGLDADWRLGRRATGLDLRRRQVELDDGGVLGYDGLVIATGAAARGWPGRVPGGVHTLRGRDDAVALQAALVPGRWLLVAGGGFLGSEIAAVAARHGLAVTLVVPGPNPMAAAVGDAGAAFLADVHTGAGIEVVVNSAVTGFTGGPRLTGARLSGGRHVRADVAVLALGAVPNTTWLDGSGLRLDRRGLACDSRGRPLLAGGGVADGVVTAGDVTRSPHPLAGGEAVALGHWASAVEQATLAAHTLLRSDAPGPHPAVPSFWSDQHDLRIRSVGMPRLADEARVVAVDRAARRLEISYHRAGRLIGALTVNRTALLARYQRELRELITN